MQQVEEEMAAVKEKTDELENTGKALKLALEVLTEAAGRYGSAVRRNLTAA